MTLQFIPHAEILCLYWISVCETLSARLDAASVLPLPAVVLAVLEGTRIPGKGGSVVRRCGCRPNTLGVENFSVDYFCTLVCKVITAISFLWN